jgi:all-trans-retinol 13,14-reductase
MSETAFDAVVIGSGLGGLTAAALLAKAGRKVCVIERNHGVGGAASAFRKGALTIEPALHQTADPHHPGEPKHAILKTLGLLDEIEWIPIDPFYSVKGGPVGEMFDLPVGFDAAHHALSTRFPKSRDGFARMLGAIERIVDGVAELMKAREDSSIGKMIRGLLESRGLIHDWRASTAEVLERHFGDDEAAKFAIAANLGYYADDPDRLAWPVFAMAQGGYLKAGGRYIKGGSRVLSMKLAKVVMTQGGSVLLGREGNRPRQFRAPRLCAACGREDQGGRTANRGEAGLRQLRAACSRAHAAGRGKGEDRARLYRAAAVDLAVLGAFRAQRPAGEDRPRPLRRDRVPRLDDLNEAVRRRRAASCARSRRQAAGLRPRQLRRDRQRACRRGPGSGQRDRP